MAEKLFLEVNIDGLSPIRAIQNLRISQRIFAHHTFELSVPASSIDSDGGKLFDMIPDIIGKDISIEWETGSFKQEVDGTDSSTFKGLVTDVSVSGERGEHMVVVIRGQSPTILMDGVANTNTYSEIKLKELFDSANGSNLTSKLGSTDNLNFKDKLPFVVQYNETDFNFISRVMHRHGEWFYYDGEQISLGIDSANTLKLTKHNVFNLDFSFNLSKPVAEFKGRDYLKHSVLDIKGAAPSHQDKIASAIADESMNLYPAHKENYLTLPSIADGEKNQLNKDGLKAELDKLKQGRSNQVFTVNGVSDRAQIKLGMTIELDGFEKEGEYLVVNVIHTCNGKDNYENHFTAVPIDSGIPGYVTSSIPKMNDCMAIVTDNKDPEQMGRVKVQFDWGQAESPWLRMLVPHSGKDRGFYFVPEINDEVMVGFEMGRADHPYVIGSLYNGKNKQDKHYNDDNQVKAIKTISGNEIIFDDRGSLTIRNGKNNITLSCDENGVLDIKTDGDMFIEAAKNMNISVGENLAVTVGGNYELAVGANMDTTVVDNYSVTAGKDSSLDSGKDFTVSSGAALNLEATSATKLSGLNTTVESTAGTELKSSAITTVKGSLVKIN